MSRCYVITIVALTRQYCNITLRKNKNRETLYLKGLTAYYVLTRIQGFHPCLWLLVIAKSFIFGDFSPVLFVIFVSFR